MDLADAHKSALNYLLTKDSQFINLNIGTGIGTSVLELVETFIDINGCDFNYIFGERRSGDSPNVIANNELATNILDWKPKKNLKDMCRDGWLYQSNLNKEFVLNSASSNLQKLF